IDGASALVPPQHGRSSLVLGWRPICHWHIVRCSSARSDFRRLSRLASNLSEPSSPITKIP
ncbi:MAG: hypothetical protein WC905_01790, partial [Patescibacteria group bacterium]